MQTQKYKTSTPRYREDVCEEHEEYLKDDENRANVAAYLALKKKYKIVGFTQDGIIYSYEIFRHIIKREKLNQNSINKRPQLNRDYTALKFEAAVLYIKNGLSAKEISERLNVSMPTLHNWSKAGQWSELRPDMELLTQYKAANLYIIGKLAPGLIAQKLSVSEMTVNYWAALNGWEAARLVSDAPNAVSNVMAAFCAHFKKLFPSEAAKIELAHNEFLKELNQ